MNALLWPLRIAAFDGDDDKGDDVAKVLGSDAGKKAIADAVAAATDGLKSKNDELLGELKKAKDNIARWEGLDPDDVRKKLASLDENDDLDMIKSGKLDELVAKRVEKVRAETEESISKIKEQLDAAQKDRDDARKKLTRKTIDDKLREVATAAKVLPEALNDVLLRANGVFSLGEDGEIESRNDRGELVRIKVGDDGTERILTPELFIESLKSSAPHFWGTGRGTGSRGSGGSGDEGRGDVANLVGVADDPVKFREMRRKAAGK